MQKARDDADEAKRVLTEEVERIQKQMDSERLTHAEAEEKLRRLEILELEHSKLQVHDDDVYRQSHSSLYVTL